MSNAIHPDYFKDFREVAQAVEEKPINEREEQALSDLSDMAGWKVLVEYIESLEQELDSLVAGAMETGLGFEEIGRKTLMATITKRYLEKIVEKVVNAKSAVQPE